MEMNQNIHYAKIFGLSKEETGFEPFLARLAVDDTTVLLVLEKEELGPFRFFPIGWDPYTKCSRVKVLANGRVYWANPESLRILNNNDKLEK